MQTQVTKKIDFTGINLYIGLDVHKKSWQVTILSDEMSLKTFNQCPEPDTLSRFLSTNFPNANFFSAYEAGFCGYVFHRRLNELGIKNIVVNPADIPRSNKDSHYKTDKSDSRLIAEALRGNLLKPIYVFDKQSEEYRSLFRSRLALAKDIRKTKNRIKSFLAYRNIEVPALFSRNPKSLAYISWLKKILFDDLNSRFQLNQLIERLEFLKGQRRCLEQQLRDITRNRDKELFNLLCTIPGIGPITAIGIMAEIGDINRFMHIKQLASYVGLIPRIKQSGETERTGRITYRHNDYIRPLLIEASWQAVRADPAMLQFYQQKCLNGNSKKAIVKVSRKLLNKIMHIMKHRVKYERGLI